MHIEQMNDVDVDHRATSAMQGVFNSQHADTGAMTNYT